MQAVRPRRRDACGGAAASIGLTSQAAGSSVVRGPSVVLGGQLASGEQAAVRRTIRGQGHQLTATGPGLTVIGPATAEPTIVGPTAVAICPMLVPTTGMATPQI